MTNPAGIEKSDVWLAFTLQKGLFCFNGCSYCCAPVELLYLVAGFEAVYGCAGIYLKGAVHPKMKPQLRSTHPLADGKSGDVSSSAKRFLELRSRKKLRHFPTQPKTFQNESPSTPALTSDKVCAHTLSLPATVKILT